LSKLNLKVRPLNITCFVVAAEIRRVGKIDEVTLHLTTPLFKKEKRFDIVVKVAAGKGKKLVEHIVKTKLWWE